MKNEEILFGYRAPQLLATNLWEISGEWKNKLGRRMTVIKFSNGDLFIHNAIRLKPSDIDWLKILGTVKYVIAPNSFHCSDAGWMVQKFPTSQLYVPQKKLHDFKTQGFAPLDIAVDFPPQLAGELTAVPMLGTKIQEVAFIHHPSRTLIFCDLAFNMGDVFTGFEKFIMNWNKVGRRFGPSRLTKIAFTKNTAQLIESYKKILTFDFDRVIVNHGDILEKNGKNLLKSGVEEIFGPL